MEYHQVDKAFRYIPNTPEQESDLRQVYDAARELAYAITACVDDKYASQAIASLTTVMSICRNAIELAPRQEKGLIV